MFEKLKQRWNVNGLQLTIVIITFATGGSLTGYVGKKLMGLLPISNGVLWTIIYIIVITIIWPVIILAVSVLTGQFRFFLNYVHKIGVRLRLIKPGIDKMKDTKDLKRIAIFASGAGSNAQKIINHFRNSDSVNIALIACNKPGAGVLNIADKENIPVLRIEKEKFFRGNAYTDELKQQNIDWIILAGFLWKIPELLIRSFPQKIINIHPALLPNYGGKGMYGQKVHEAVLANKEEESGITIHYVDNLYDHGKIIFQAKCPVLHNDTAESLAQRIHGLEHQHFPLIIEQLVTYK